MGQSFAIAHWQLCKWEMYSCSFRTVTEMNIFVLFKIESIYPDEINSKVQSLHFFISGLD